MRCDAQKRYKHRNERMQPAYEDIAWLANTLCANVVRKLIRIQSDCEIVRPTYIHARTQNTIGSIRLPEYSQFSACCAESHPIRFIATAAAAAVAAVVVVIAIVIVVV